MSDDEWSHQNKEWQITLDLARKYGWTSKKASNHGGLTLACPTGDHKFRVFSTGKSTENVAHTKRVTIRSCPHGNITAPLDQVEERLDTAERLLHAAETLMSRTEAELHMEHAVEMLDQADDNLAQAEGAFSAAEEEFDRADASVKELAPTEVTAGADRLVGDAGSKIRQATLTLRELPVHNERVESLSERRDGLRERVVRAKERLPK